MSPDRSVETSALATVICNVILYGSYLIIFPICMFLLIQSRLKGLPVHWILFLAAITQFFLSTIYVSAQLYMVFYSFVGLQSPSLTLSTSIPSTPSTSQNIVPEPSPTWWREPPTMVSARSNSERVTSLSGWEIGNGETWTPIALYWLDRTSPVQILSNVTCFFNIVIGDILLIWRVYFVWARNWVVCLPSLSSLTAALVCAIILICKESTISYSDTSTLAGAAWAFSIVTQMMSTILITFRIWHAGHSPALQGRMSQPGTVKNPYRKLLWIIIESGALYSAVALALLIFYSIRRMDAATVLMYCTGQISAIIPASIIIFVHINLASPSAHSRNASNMISDHRIAFASVGNTESIERIEES